MSGGVSSGTASADKAGSGAAAPTTADRDAELLRHVLGAMREPALVTDTDGKVVCASRGAESLFDLSGRLVGESLVDLLPPSSQPDGHELLRAEAQSAREFTVTTAAGTTTQVVGEAANVGDWVFWTFHELEGEDSVLHPAFERLVEGLSEAVVAVDRQLIVRRANRSALRFGPFKAGERLPARWGDFDLETFAGALFEPGAIHAEALVRPREGTHLTLIGMPGRARSRALLLITNTTEREQRERREREFVANAAHELQTPLTAIVGAIDVLEAGAIDDLVTRERFLRHLRRESERLVRLVQSLLILARATAGPDLRASSIEVRPLLDRVAGQLEPVGDVWVEIVCEPGLRATTHAELAERAVLNLAENAVKHTTRGHIVLSGREDAQGVVLEVADTGSGMTVEETARATDRFYRGGGRDGDGFGLGLSIVRQIAGALSAEFELESRAGEGTVARLVLPSVNA